MALSACWKPGTEASDCHELFQYREMRVSDVERNYGAYFGLQFVNMRRHILYARIYPALMSGYREGRPR
jgi:hypothetical protein